MPELPEVESTARYLNERVRNKLIEAADVLWNRSIASPSIKEFKESIIGRRILEVSRRGKLVHLRLDAGFHLFIHLRMSGSLDVVSRSADPDKHDRVVLYLTSGKVCRFNDTRKFGKIWLTKDPMEVMGHLGPEPFDRSLTPSIFHDMLSRKKTKIKSLLLDQTFIAGIGNIYADEVLWSAKINPLTSSAVIDRSSATRLLSSIRRILTKAIDHLGTDFGDGVVDGGMYTPRVYGREDKGCHRCSSKISRTIVGQRSTHFCPKCQCSLPIQGGNKRKMAKPRAG